MVARATTQIARIASDSFSLFFTPFQMLALVSTVSLVCGKRVCHANGSTVGYTAVTYPKFFAETLRLRCADFAIPTWARQAAPSLRSSFCCWSNVEAARRELGR